MEFPSTYISAGDQYADFGRFVPAPYFRKSFVLRRKPLSARLLVTGLGFYRVWVNGKEITKGILAPYISNPDHLVYFDRYDLAPYLAAGENVLGFQLGNGMQNAPGGTVWDFQKAPWRGAPKLSFALDLGAVRVLSADERVKTAPSPVLFDDLRCGVRYDARKEIPGWNAPGFDDTLWANAVLAPAPRGEARLCEAEPILPTGEALKPVSVKPAGVRQGIDLHRLVKDVPGETDVSSEGLLFDFGVNAAGLPRLRVNGAPGQKIELQFAEFETDGELDFTNINFYPEGYAQRDVYICGGGDEVFVPPFTYHGFRYCLVSGLTPAQAAADPLRYIVYSSAIPKAGDFASSDETANRLYAMAERSDRANLYYFPTDCPHREKNGWTGDAALSAEHMLMTMHCAQSCREWMRNIRKAQRADGSLPGIIPTDTWGYDGFGPSWDAVIAEIPYMAWFYTGEKEILAENAEAILRYLRYAAARRSPEGLVDYGLGDWCPVRDVRKACVEYTASLSLMRTAETAEIIFGALGQPERQAEARALFAELKAALRKKYVDEIACIAESGSQTAQSMALYYGLFTPRETEKAQAQLIKAVHENGDFLDVGILGARCLFHALSAAGQTPLAYRMITRPEYPSYGHFIACGLTALPESFEVGSAPTGNGSANHHMFGDIKSWFIKRVAGLVWRGPLAPSPLSVEPCFIESLGFAEASFESPFGPVRVRWERQGPGEISLTVAAPQGLSVHTALPEGWRTDAPLPERGGFTLLLRR